MKEKILEFLEKNVPAIDKLKHFYWGSCITFIGIILYLLTDYLFFLWTPTFLAALAKELMDDKPSFWDFYYTVLTSVIITILVLAIL